MSEQLIRQKTISLTRSKPWRSTRLEAQIQVLKTELVSPLEQHYAREMPLLCSIPWIVRKTAAMLLLFAKEFTHVENYRQLTAKAGLCPCEYSSGTNVRGKSRITRMGGGLIRSKLFMCSFSAKNPSAACKALYDRLATKGKNGKLALIAVCNKLLKQACAIIKAGIPYQPDSARISA